MRLYRNVPEINVETQFTNTNIVICAHLFIYLFKCTSINNNGPPPNHRLQWQLSRILTSNAWHDSSHNSTTLTALGETSHCYDVLAVLTLVIDIAIIDGYLPHSGGLAWNCFSVLFHSVWNKTLFWICFALFCFSCKSRFIFVTFAGMPSGCVSSHSDQLSLLSSAGREMSTGQRAVAVLSGWEGNRRSGVILAMRVVSTFALYGLRRSPCLESYKEYSTLHFLPLHSW